MSTVVVDRNRKTSKLLGLLSIIAGAILILAGGVTWGMVQSQLSAENITVAGDADMFAGQQVKGPLTAYAQADIINKHALESSGGKTYAELSQDDPARATVMNGSFLRASLFTSVIAFGIAAFAIGLGVLFIIVGWAIRLLSAPVEAITPAAQENSPALS